MGILLFSDSLSRQSTYNDVYHKHGEVLRVMS